MGLAFEGGKDISSSENKEEKMMEILGWTGKLIFRNL